MGSRKRTLVADFLLEVLGALVIGWPITYIILLYLIQKG